MNKILKSKNGRREGERGDYRGERGFVLQYFNLCIPSIKHRKGGVGENLSILQNQTG